MQQRSAIMAGPAPLLLAAVAWSWGWWAASIAFGGAETTTGALTRVAGVFGPAIVVGATLWRTSPGYRSAFRGRMLKARVAPRWWLAAVVLGSVPRLFATSVAALGGHVAAGEGIAILAVPVSLAFGVMYAAIEEPLWHGVALDAFGAARVKASLVVGLVWSVWHVPLFAIRGTFQHGLGLGTLDFWVFLIWVAGLAVLLTWLVVGSGGSLLLAMVMHLLINLTADVLPGDTTVRTLEAIVIWLLAPVALYRLGRLEGASRVNQTSGGRP